MSLGAASFFGRPFGRGTIPASSLRSFRLSRLSSSLTTCLSLKPKCCAISLCVFPSACIALISGNNPWICVYFRFSMTIPPDVVLFSYIRGLFLYCTFLLVRFNSPQLFLISISWKRCPDQCRRPRACSSAARRPRSPSGAWPAGHAWR